MAKFIVINYGAISVIIINFYLTLEISAHKKHHLDEWEVWKSKYDRSYDNVEEEAWRKAIFISNLARINAHNNAAEKPDFFMAVNQFSDMDRSEVVKRYSGLKFPSKSLSAIDDVEPDKRADVKITKKGSQAATTKPTTKKPTTKKPTTKKPTTKKPTTKKPTTKKPSTKKPTTKKSTTASKKSALSKKFPASLDWRKLGAVTPVEEQGSCAGCWAFSVTGAIEGRLKIKTGKLIHLSEQNLLDCSRKYGNSGCEGGWMEYAYDYIAANGGLNLAESYPFKEATVNDNKWCKYNPKKAYGALLPKKPYVMLLENNETAMIEALQSGPVSVAFDTNVTSFQAYSSGIYSETDCSPENVNHAMLVVGYGIDTSTRKPYWIVKNSYSRHWGEKGYIRVARGGNKNICGILSFGNYPILK